MCAVSIKILVEVFFDSKLSSICIAARLKVMLDFGGKCFGILGFFKGFIALLSYAVFINIILSADMTANAYANDYRDICELKQLADKHKIAILLVHHLRKHADRDPFMMVSGTTDLTGGVDTTYVLEKDKRSDNAARLYVTGRDVEYMELSLQLENCIWECLSCGRFAHLACVFYQQQRWSCRLPSA